VDRSGEQPIQGAKVELFVSYDGGMPELASLLEERGLERSLSLAGTSTEEGIAELPRTPFGTFTLRASHPSYETLEVTGVVVDGAPRTAVDLGTFALRAKQAIRLLVTDHKGQPAARAVAVASIWRGGMAHSDLPPVQANDAGELEIRGVPPDDATMITVLAAGAVVVLEDIRPSADILPVAMPAPGF
jgi:hypothetical protein